MVLSSRGSATVLWGPLQGFYRAFFGDPISHSLLLGTYDVLWTETKLSQTQIQKAKAPHMRRKLTCILYTPWGLVRFKVGAWPMDRQGIIVCRSELVKKPDTIRKLVEETHSLGNRSGEVAVKME